MDPRTINKNDIIDSATEEERTRAFEMKAELKIYQLHQLTELIHLAATRGAFHGSELSYVGTLYDNLNTGVYKAFKIICQHHQ